MNKPITATKLHKMYGDTFNMTIIDEYPSKAFENQINYDIIVNDNYHTIAKPSNTRWLKSSPEVNSTIIVNLKKTNTGYLMQNLGEITPASEPIPTDSSAPIRSYTTFNELPEGYHETWIVFIDESSMKIGISGRVYKTYTSTKIPATANKTICRIRIKHNAKKGTIKYIEHVDTLSNKEVEDFLAEPIVDFTPSNPTGPREETPSDTNTFPEETKVTSYNGIIYGSTYEFIADPTRIAIVSHVEKTPTDTVLWFFDEKDEKRCTPVYLFEAEYQPLTPPWHEDIPPHGILCRHNVDNYVLAVYKSHPSETYADYTPLTNDEIKQFLRN